MQVSALTVPVRGISHFCCHKSTFTSLVTVLENYFWLGKTSPGLFFFIWRAREDFFIKGGAAGGEIGIRDGRGREQQMRVGGKK